MHYPKPTQNSAHPKDRYNFDTLDWITAILVVATPVFIVYQLIWN